MWVIFVRWSAKVEEEKGGRGRGEEGEEGSGGKRGRRGGKEERVGRVGKGKVEEEEGRRRG